MSNIGSNIRGRIGVFIYGGFQEMEFWYPVLRLREIGADVAVIGVDGAASRHDVQPHVRQLTVTAPPIFARLVLAAQF